MIPGGSNRVPKPISVPEVLPLHLPKDRLSIAVFGPGKGEAIVVRLPDGSVGVVDGCREPKDGNAKGIGDPVRELLNHFEAEWPAHKGPFRLAFVCLTHPHDDHYAGVGRLLEAYQGRIDHVWTVTHVTERVANTLVSLSDLTRAGKHSLPDGADADGLIRAVAQIHAAQKTHNAELKHLQSGQPLLRVPDSFGFVTVTACGPASGDVHAAGIGLIAAILATEREQNVPSSHDPNLTSGALVIRWGTAGILLAGDLLLGKGPRSGWEYARAHVGEEIQVVNVAHHASEEAHHDALWAEMRPALAIVTPFKEATGKQPPRRAQIELLAQTSVVAITSPPAWMSEENQPCSLSSHAPRDFKAKPGPLKIVPSSQADARRNAVVVSLDSTGKITHFVLAGKADVYLAPGEATLPTTPMSSP